MASNEVGLQLFGFLFGDAEAAEFSEAGVYSVDCVSGFDEFLQCPSALIDSLLRFFRDENLTVVTGGLDYVFDCECFAVDFDFVQFVLSFVTRALTLVRALELVEVLIFVFRCKLKKEWEKARALGSKTVFVKVLYVR
jgi:hypothetical protein